VEADLLVHKSTSVGSSTVGAMLTSASHLRAQRSPTTANYDEQNEMKRETRHTDYRELRTISLPAKVA
jgi:hypothetical protein